MSAVRIATAKGRNISAETIKRVLRKADYNRTPARKIPHENLSYHEKKIAFAEKHTSEPEDFWNNDIFRDKRKFNVFGNDSRSYAWAEA
ncbi:hypothetical protein AVEN_59971-1 [Araneus ventricosus]|uniref:Transposase Tc1-like domain-containing protein n=1 Tax=Araneus ventricosus TaxID=182803 RepID=A0A4Y2I6C8_ARAVE|nr:hypothetical protein AVEN_59971-1 [Araneus ventricosus]